MESQDREIAPKSFPPALSVTG